MCRDWPVMLDTSASVHPASSRVTTADFRRPWKTRPASWIGASFETGPPSWLNALRQLARKPSDVQGVPRLDVRIVVLTGLLPPSRSSSFFRRVSKGKQLLMRRDDKQSPRLLLAHLDRAASNRRLGHRQHVALSLACVERET